MLKTNKTKILFRWIMRSKKIKFSRPLVRGRKSRSRDPRGPNTRTISKYQEAHERCRLSLAVREIPTQAIMSFYLQTQGWFQSKTWGFKVCNMDFHVLLKYTLWKTGIVSSGWRYLHSVIPEFYFLENVQVTHKYVHSNIAPNSLSLETTPHHRLVVIHTCEGYKHSQRWIFYSYL